MWEQLNLDDTYRPGKSARGGRLAASFRQLLRARDAADAVAERHGIYSFNFAIQLMLKDLLRNESTWPSDERGFEGLCDHKILFQRPARVRVPGAMIWLIRDVDNQWAAPFDADLEFTHGLQDLGSYTIRFGDKRVFADEDFQESLARIPGDVEAGRVEWAFEFRGGGGVTPHA